MMEFINSCIRWVADNYKGILTVLTSAQFISLITACALLVKTLRSGKDNTTATVALNDTMTKNNENTVTVTNIAEKVNKLETANANIVKMISDNKGEETEYLDALTTKLNAILGRMPKSSRRVNNGKNIAIGGSITDTTQATVLYMPLIKTPESHEGAFK